MEHTNFKLGPMKLDFQFFVTAGMFAHKIFSVWLFIDNIYYEYTLSMGYCMHLMDLCSKFSLLHSVLVSTFQSFQQDFCLL